MTARLLRFLPLLLAAACAPEAYAPPARAIALDAPTVPRAGGTDAQAELGAIGTVFGPSLSDSNLRIRHAVSKSVVIEGETGRLRDEDAGSIVAVQPVARTSGTAPTAPAQPSNPSRDAYTGRAGVMLHGRDEHVQGALTAGLGGGYSPTAGGWTSIDVGGSFGGTNHWIRPWTSGDLGVNLPWGSRELVVSDGTTETALVMTSDLMARWTVGVELGPPAYTALLGLSFTRIFADSNGALGASAAPGGDGYIGAGVGFRARL